MIEENEDGNGDTLKFEHKSISFCSWHTTPNVKHGARLSLQLMTIIDHYHVTTAMLVDCSKYH